LVADDQNNYMPNKVLKNNHEFWQHLNIINNSNNHGSNTHYIVQQTLQGPEK
jgi:hypothetical protein